MYDLLKEKNVVKFNLYMEDLVIISLLLLLTRAVSLFRIHRYTRSLISMIKQVFVDMLSFLFVQLIFVVIFSVIFLELGKVQKIVTTDPAEIAELDELSFYENFRTSFNIASTGDFENFIEFNEFSFTVFVVTSLFQNIVMLNLLVAIISDTFDKVQEKQTASDC